MVTIEENEVGVRKHEVFRRRFRQKSENETIVFVYRGVSMRKIK